MVFLMPSETRPRSATNLEGRVSAVFNKPQ